MPHGTGEDLDQVAAAIADDLLFAAALEVDRRAEIPATHFRALADAGLFGIAGPAPGGGLDLDLWRQRRLRETLAGGCLTTAFVWAQHHGVVRCVRDAGAELREAWLEPLRSGRRIGGQALAGLHPGPPLLRIEPAGGDWTIAGASPMVTGWGYIDVLLVAARLSAEEVVFALLDTSSDGLRAHPRDLAALNGTRTVELHFDDVRVPGSAVVRATSLPPWAAIGEGVRANGALSLGVCGRCARIAGVPELTAEVDRHRDALDVAADGDELAQARADAALLAVRAAAYVVADRGSAAVDMREHAQRLAREALFLLAFGQRPAIKEALRRGLLSRWRPA